MKPGCSIDMFDHNAELEESIGEFLTAKRHSHRLKNKLSDKVAGYVHLGGGYYRRENDATSSMTTFFHKGKFYVVSLRVEEMPSPSKRLSRRIAHCHIKGDDKK